MKIRTILLTGSIIFLLFAFGHMPAPAPADKIFINGKIITVDPSNSIADAVAVKDGKIIAVGSAAGVLQYKNDKTTIIDLRGHTMIPGFVDGHSHFMGLTRARAVNLNPPPVGNVHNIPELIDELKKFKATKNISDGDWITGYGYDQEQLAERRHPTKEDLDAAFPDNPVVITHVSGHMLVANSAALKASGIDSNTPNPPGGVIVRKPGTTEPAGLLQERASALLKRRSGNHGPMSFDEELQLFKDQEAFYASCGITTAQEGSTALDAVRFLRKAAATGALYLDIVSLPAYAGLDSLLADPTVKFRAYDHHLKLEGFKLIADGSPQGKTAFFSKPYLTDVPGCSLDDCRGVPTVTQAQFNEAILKGFRNNIQTFVHCNGDATIDMYIAAVENAKKMLHTTSIDRRPVVIHSQFVRPDQLDKYKELGMVPSFFTNHTFFWGDVHIKNLGQDRGYFESPLKTAEEKGIVFANHTDYGVTPLSQMFLLWTSVMRESRSGKVIGPEQRLTPMEGLRALTINGAYLYFEEKTKGSIEKGKLADFAILSDDPLTIDPEKIKDITVLETIKEGQTIYKKEAPTADKIYINGHILTMDAAGTEKEAVAIADGKILATGATKEMESLKGPSTTIVDLGGKTLLPGFVDGHSHFMALELAGAVNIFSPPVGPVKNIPGIIRQLQDFVKTHPLKKGEWLTAFGYDIDQMEEKRHPAKEDIDKAFPDIPVMLIHASGHMCVVNSAALKVSGVTAATPDPPGGQIVRKPGSQEPTGLLLENGRTVLKFGSSKPSLEQQFVTLQKQQEYYASMGITTAQDGYSSLDGIRLLKAAAEHHLLKMDIEALPGYFILDSLKGDPALVFNVLHDHFKLAGFKMVADGSPQGKTAFMSQPYLTPAPGCTDHCTGIPTVTQAQLNAAVQRGFREHIHPFVHCNGDGAIDMYIHAVRTADSMLSTTSTDKRPVIIHSQFVRADQLDQYKQLGMLPSFFTNHAFFWGDTHEQNLGIPRAAFLSPLHTALGKGILFTNHTDFPVTPVNQIFLLWTSVVRQSRSGKTIGPEERLTPMQGLRAITINGAYEYFEEDIKGSIEKGKLADMVILSGNPLTIAPEKIKDIQVLETIKEGNTIFKRS